MTRKQYSIHGIPSDTLTGDKIGERAYKVAIDNMVELNTSLALTVIELESSNKRILEQLKLLNDRFEEAFNTGLTEIDHD